MIAQNGSEAMRAEYLPRLATMELIVSYCLTEPGSGSDAAALRTRAERTNDGYRLTALYRPPRQRALDPLVRACRQRFGARLVPDLIHRRQDWVYRHDVTATVPPLN